VIPMNNNMNDILRRFDSTATVNTTKVSGPSGDEMVDILTKLSLLESDLTPVNVKHGLNKQQKSVDQLSATFKPKTVKVLGTPTDPKNPMAGKLVGGCESVEKNDPVLEDEVSEDILATVKKSLEDYLKSIDDIEKIDTDLKKKLKGDTDIKKKEKKDRDLVSKKVWEEPAQENPVQQPKSEPMINNTYSNNLELESAIKSHRFDDGKIFEVVGNENTGFHIRHNNRISPSKFRTFTEADTALELFKNRVRPSCQDYKEEK